MQEFFQPLLGQRCRNRLLRMVRHSVLLAGLCLLVGCKSGEVAVQTTTIPLAIPAIMLRVVSDDLHNYTNHLYTPKQMDERR